MIEEIKDKTTESLVPIYLRVKAQGQSIQIDNQITPLFCLNCSRQLPNFYWLKGSRYGQVGSVICECGATIHCVDNDNAVESLETFTEIRGITKELSIDYREIYNLDTSIWRQVWRATGYDIIDRHRNQVVTLSDVFTEISAAIGLGIPSDANYTRGVFQRLPTLINNWNYLLDILRVATP